MFKSPKVFALDLGTTKFCLGELNLFAKSKDDLVKTVMVDAQGMRRGMLSDFQLAKKALLSLIQVAEEQFRSDIEGVCVSISGSHLRSEVLDETMAVNKKEIDLKILNKLRDLAKQKQGQYKSEPLDCIPTSYAIDKRGVLDNPLGFTAQTLFGQFLHIYADQSYLKDVVRLCNQCGLRVQRMFAEPIVSASAIVDPLNIPHGFVVADIGGGTTDATIFLNHRPVKIFTVDIGGKMFTNDLSIAMGINSEEAERLKVEVGIASEETYSGDRAQAQYVLGARASELCHLIDVEIKPYKSLLKSGLFLTGGGACLRGIAELFREQLDIPVLVKQAKLTNTQSLKFGQDLDFATKYATVIGLLVSYANVEKSLQEMKRFSFFERRFPGLSQWLADMS